MMSRQYCYAHAHKRIVKIGRTPYTLLNLTRLSSILLLLLLLLIDAHTKKGAKKERKLYE